MSDGRSGGFEPVWFIMERKRNSKASNVLSLTRSSVVSLSRSVIADGEFWLRAP